MVNVTKHDTPALRFDGFSGEWEHRELNQIGVKSTATNADAALTETFTNSARYGIISQLEYFDHAVSNPANISKYFVVEPDDFVYNPRISVTAPFGPINRNRLSRSGAMSPLYLVFKFFGVDHRFLEQFFKTDLWHDFMRLNGDVGARHDRFSIGDAKFMEMEIPTPFLEEQRAIGELFADLDALIEQHRAKYANLQQTKTALMQRMFPQDDADEPELRLGGFSGAWGAVSFDSLLTRVEIGINTLGSNRYHGIPLLKMGNIQRGYFDFSSFERLPDNAELPSGSLVRTGDFLFNTRNTMELVGKGATWMGESGAFAFNGNIARFTLERVDTKFFNYLYNHPRSIRDVSKCATGTTSVAAIYPRSLKSVQFQIPTLEEQCAIGDVFSNLDALIAAEQRYITQLAQVKTALLQRMFV